MGEERIGIPRKQEEKKIGNLKKEDEEQKLSISGFLRKKTNRLDPYRVMKKNQERQTDSCKERETDRHRKNKRKVHSWKLVKI